MSDAVRPLLVVVGGFLGSGKTTTIGHTAKLLRESGQRVAVITNDQSNDLVDTEVARSENNVTVEIPGGCFCCQFDVLHDTLSDLVGTNAIDIALAEAVGSCTDLAATVYQPLRQLGSNAVDLAPLTIVVDGPRLRDLVNGRELSGFPESVSYLFERQIAESDIVLLNKCDLLGSDEDRRLRDYLVSTFPGVEVQAISALHEEGLEGWKDRLVATHQAGDRVLEIDYDRYANAEAALGWLNLSGMLVLKRAEASTDWTRAVLTELAASAGLAGVEVAHVKVWLDTAGGGIRGHLASRGQPPEIFVTGTPVSRGRVLINARLPAPPEMLQLWVESAIQRACELVDGQFQSGEGDAFSPARPVPLHRLLPATA